MDKFPDGILNFKNLQRLYLGYCNIDSIPDGIYRLSKLQELTCESRDLKKLPTSIGNMMMRGRSRGLRDFETPADRQRNNGLPAFLV